jgi:hypothetical protein
MVGRGGKGGERVGEWADRTPAIVAKVAKALAIIILDADLYLAYHPQGHHP